MKTLRDKKVICDQKEKPRRHKGDIMSPEKRSALMSRIKGKDTKPEMIMKDAFFTRGFVYENHVKDLPGRPDFVFRKARLVVFIDGDFWHGWRFPIWRDKLSPKWETKIEANRRRDVLNHQRLRRRGWKVIRIWEHQIKKSPEKCLEKIETVLQYPNIDSGNLKKN